MSIVLSDRMYSLKGLICVQRWLTLHGCVCEYVMVVYKKFGRGQHEQMNNNDAVMLAYSLTIVRWNYYPRTIIYHELHIYVYWSSSCESYQGYANKTAGKFWTRGLDI